jgi:hypothetical protein
MWGPHPASKDILINGMSFRVTAQLMGYLEVHAARFPGTWIWIDQICIDQRSTEERNEQVALMSKIYRRASEVVIWINPSSRAECRITDQIQHFYGKEGQWKCDRLADLLTNDYWVRVWILQEVLLGHARKIYYGDCELTWSQLHRLVDGNRQHYEPTIPNQLLWLLLNPATTTFQQLDFGEAISNCSESKSKDPRDKVYGLQGLIRRNQRVHVDYNKSVKEVFIDAAIIYPVHSDQPGGLATLARAMGITFFRKAGGPTSMLGLMYENIDWYIQWGQSSRSEAALRNRLRRYLDGPEVPGQT